MPVLQDGEPGHEPCGERRMPRAVMIDGAETLPEEAPIDRSRELHQCMVHIDDLIEPRFEQIVLARLPSLSRPH